jgi:hypothetical protein
MVIVVSNPNGLLSLAWLAEVDLNIIIRVNKLIMTRPSQQTVELILGIKPQITSKILKSRLKLCCCWIFLVHIKKTETS